MKKWLLFCIIVLLTACASIGPRQVSLDRMRYNSVIQETNNEQLLLNIVRLRYVEPSTFLKLGNVTASYTLSQGANLSYTSVSGHASDFSRTWLVNPSITYSDTPTISYSPVEDADFVNEILSPTKIRNLVLLSAGGIYDPFLIFRLVPESLGEVDNASYASSAKMIALPHYHKYQYLIRLMRLAIVDEKARFLPSEVGDHINVTLVFSKKYLTSSTALAIKRMLNVPANSPTIIFTDNPARIVGANMVLLRTRSIYGIMIFLSYSIDIPPSDYNVVYHYFYPDGRPFDWGVLMHGMMHIYSSDSEPLNAFVKTYFHGHWFFIKDCDVDSKATFSLVIRLMTLTAGNQLSKSSPAPVVTIPAVSR